MTVIGLGAKQRRMDDPDDLDEGEKEKEKDCEEVGVALDKGTLGDIVANHEKLILKYYKDVQQHAKQSFELARSIAWIGFFVLMGSMGCAIILDILFRFNMGVNVTEKSLTIGTVGL